MATAMRPSARVLANGRSSAALAPSILPRRIGRARPLQIVAFRDTHRAETLESVTKEFSHGWSQGLCGGVTHHTLEVFEPMCDPSLEVRSVHPMGCSSCKGVEALSAKLARDFKALSGAAVKDEVKVLLTGSNDASDISFCLLQLPPMAKPAEGAPASAAHDPSYMLLKMDWLLDDTVRRVTSVIERGQLAGGFDLPIKQKQMDASKKLQQIGCTQTPQFPTHLITPWAVHAEGTRPGAPCPDMVEKVQKALGSWVAARSSQHSATDMMAQAGCTNDFQMFDGYGLMPMMCEVASANVGETGGNSCMLRKEQVQNVLDAVKKVYDVECRVVDCAVSLNEAAGFVHWKATHRNKQTGNTFDVEGMEVDLFEPSTGALRAVYLFGDALDFENQLISQEMNA